MLVDITPFYAVDADAIDEVYLQQTPSGNAAIVVSYKDRKINVAIEPTEEESETKQLLGMIAKINRCRSK